MGEYAFLHFPAEAVHVDPSAFAALPPSAQRAFETIRDEGPVTHKQLVASTGMPSRTVRFAVKRLKEEGLIDARCSLRDCRTCYFFVAKRCVGLDALQATRARAFSLAAQDHRLIEQVG